MLIVIMNRVRGQKKDVTRVLRTMKAEQPSGYEHKQSLSQSKDFTKSRDLAALYSSKSKKPELEKKPRRNLRYERGGEEHDHSQGAMRKYQKSLELRKVNMLRIGIAREEGEAQVRNPYSRNSGSIYVPRLSRNKAGKRLLTQQATRISTQEAIRVPTQEAMKQQTKIGSLIVNNESDVASVEEIEIRMRQGKLIEAQKMLQRVVRADPENIKALYLKGVNNYHLREHVKSLTCLNKVVQKDPVYKDNAYILSALCYCQLGKLEQAIERLTEGLAYFPDSYDTHFHKGAILMKMNRFEEALPSLKKALKFALTLYEPLMKLAECYENLNSYKLAVKLYEEVSEQPNYGKGYLHYLKKARCLEKLHDYEGYIETVQMYLKLCPAQEVENFAQIYFGLSYAHYKLKNYAAAIMSIEEVLKEKSKEYCTKAIVLLTVIYIFTRDFYEALHALARKEHLDVDEDELAFYEMLCEGVVCLMKRKFEQGLEKLERIQFSAQDSPSGEFQRQIGAIYPMYLSYALFCEGNMSRCLEEIEKALQSEHPELQKFKPGLNFNRLLCQGLQLYRKNSLTESVAKFEESTKIYCTKPEGYLYLGLTQAQLYLRTTNQQFLDACHTNLSNCISNLKELNNNYAASAFYCKSLISIHLQNWDAALNEIDEAIERAEENEAKMFYLRGLILACCQNYKQAIHEVSVAISINNEEASYFLLRSKCYQIEGEGSKAFSDLQTYININPEDLEIHKYAGHLLFENGAFEDALQAFENGNIAQAQENIDVFLTRGKTYFLLGNFESSIEDMQTSLELKGKDPGIQFDICIIEQIMAFFSSVNHVTQYQNQKQKLQVIEEKLGGYQLSGNEHGFGRIFRRVELKVLQALICYHKNQYRQAIRLFYDSIKLKELDFLENTQEEFEEEEKEKHLFISQMNYNKALCHLWLNEKAAAISCLHKCKIDPASKVYNKLEELLQILDGNRSHKQEDSKDQSGKIVITYDLFSQKSKMSKHLSERPFEFENYILKIKPCIPFPKVEPPEISPKFDTSLLIELNPKLVERKPEAPWIVREDNSIKFTQKIERFSRLEINNSQLSRGSEQKREEEFNDSYLNREILQKEGQSMRDLKEKLRLDEKVLNKLNNLMMRK